MSLGYNPIFEASWSISYDSCHVPSHSKSSVSPDLLFFRTIFILEGLEWNIIICYFVHWSPRETFLILKDSLKNGEITPSFPKSRHWLNFCLRYLHHWHCGVSSLRFRVCVLFKGLRRDLVRVRVHFELGLTPRWITDNLGERLSMLFRTLRLTSATAINPGRWGCSRERLHSRNVRELSSRTQRRAS